MKIVHAAIMIGFMACPAAAQTVVGRAVVDGRTVNLFDDQSWAYEQPGTPGCATLSVKLSFCGDKAQWTESRAPSTDVIASYSHDDKHYAQYIIEDLGTAQGLTAESVRKVILDFAKQAGGKDPIIISIEPATLGSLTGETIVYSFNVSGIDTVYANSVFLTENTLLQAMTYFIGTEYSDKHKALQADFLAATQLKAD